jgi:hypothetical protein
MDQWTEMADEREVALRRRNAELRLRDLSLDQVENLRKRAKNDLFFLSSILEYDRLSVRLHGGLCTWLEENRGVQYRSQLLPRGHFKSTVITIADAIQMALPNDAGIEAHPYNLGPNVKILLAHENRESASRFLFEIAAAFLKKEIILALFPECIPSARVQRINKWELELPRQEHHKEPTFDTIGAGGAAQGRHYHWLKLDDLVGEDARDSETVMGRVLTWFDNVNSLLTRPKYDGWDLTGTRWSATDVYSHAMEMYGLNKSRSLVKVMSDEDYEKVRDGLMVLYARGAIENGKPLFPEEFSLDYLNVLRQNPIVWAAQYANNPKDAGMTEFDRGWLRFYNVAGPHLIIFDGETSRKVNIWELDRTILVDPSMGESKRSDETGLVVVGTDKMMNVYVLETIKTQHIPPKLVDLIFELNAKWSPRVVSIEEVAFSAIYRYWIEEKSKGQKNRPRVVPYKPGSRKSKEARIRGLTPFFSAGQVFLSRNMHDLLDEYEWFPVGKSKHLLDALAQGPGVWAPGLTERDADEFRKAEELVMNARDIETGY